MSVSAVRGFVRFLGPLKQIPPVTAGCLRLDPLSFQHDQVRGYPSVRHQKLIAAAQKRNRARKLQKQEEVEVDFVSSQKNEALKKTALKSRRYNPRADLPSEPHDDVYFRSWYREHTHNLEECILMHRELMHPTMLNLADNVVVATVELNMHTKKKNRYLEGFEGTLLYPHSFSNKSRITRILCFCRSGDEAAMLMENGADLAGGPALVKKIVAGEEDWTQFDHILCSSDMIEEIHPLRTIIRKKMPVAGKTIAVDALALVQAYRKSIVYEVKRDVYEPDYAQFSVPLARLDMPLDQIEENLKMLFTEVNEHMPTGRPVNSFISELFLSCPPSSERFVLNREPYEKYIIENPAPDEVTGKNKKKHQKAAQQRVDEVDASDDDHSEEGASAAQKA